jgi:hypothetical protein
VPAREDICATCLATCVPLTHFERCPQLARYTVAALWWRCNLLSLTTLSLYQQPHATRSNFDLAHSLWQVSRRAINFSRDRKKEEEKAGDVLIVAVQRGCHCCTAVLLYSQGSGGSMCPCGQAHVGSCGLHIIKCPCPCELMLYM